MQLAVLSPSRSEQEQHFPSGAAAPDDRVHAPINCHAYAACTGGSLVRKVSSIPAHANGVLLLLGNSLGPAWRALQRLRRLSLPVAIAWKECGVAQVARRLDNAANLALFSRLCAAADGAVSATPELVPVFLAAGAARAEYIPTPYPLADTRWDFGKPLAERRGIFLGTREFAVPTRAHAAALLVALATGAPVTVCNTEGRHGRRRITALRRSTLGNKNLRVIEGRLPYSQHLREMAACRVVFQLDTSLVPGQVAGDALLCRMPCVGGNSAIEREAFAGLELRELLANDNAWHAAVLASQARAARSLAYAPVANQLARFFAACQRNAAR